MFNLFELYWFRDILFPFCMTGLLIICCIVMIWCVKELVLNIIRTFSGKEYE